MQDRDLTAKEINKIKRAYAKNADMIFRVSVSQTARILWAKEKEDIEIIEDMVSDMLGDFILRGCVDYEEE